MAILDRRETALLQHRALGSLFRAQSATFENMENPKRFAVVGVAGFIAPRHLKAIKETGNSLVAAVDPSDSVGIIDQYFPEADFFTEYERFDRHLDKLRRERRGVGIVSICSPNYLHDAHIRMALRNSADAICEKPIVLNPWNVDALTEIELETGHRVRTILQLRHHPEIIALRDRYAGLRGRVVDVDVTYVASRGRWYHRSWKGSAEKSGGVATNIGVHFFDMLGWIFGGLQSSVVHRRQHDCAAGVLDLERARVRWFLSVNSRHLPSHAREQGQRTYRSITVDGTEVEFSEGFADLHTVSYREILAERGFGLEDARPSIEMVHAIRHAAIAPARGEFHPRCLEVEVV
jgi:UDP-N-acetyl-2-amino-2-deoxyglucuronate dehydrogenase